MGNQTGVLEEDSGVYSHHSLFFDSHDLSDNETGPINSTPKKNLQHVKHASLLKSTSVAIDLRTRLDSSGLNLSSSEEEDEEIRAHQTDAHKNNFIYSVSL